MTLTFVLWPWYSIGSCGCLGKCLCAKYRQGKCSGSCVIVRTNIFALSRNGKESENPVLWPYLRPKILKFSGFRAFVKVHVAATFRQAGISGLWVIVLTGTKNSDEKNTVRRYGVVRGRPSCQGLVLACVCAAWNRCGKVEAADRVLIVVRWSATRRRVAAGRWRHIWWARRCRCVDAEDSPHCRTLCPLQHHSVRLSANVSILSVALWLNGLVVSALEIRARWPRFESRVAPLFHWVVTLGKLFTHTASQVSQFQETGVQKRVFGAEVVAVIKCARLSWALS